MSVSDLPALNATLNGISTVLRAASLNTRENSFSSGASIELV